jgi:uncharacterized membrane protein YraQ (UPF0718 family)
VGIVTGTEGRVREALEKFEKGGLKTQEEAPPRGALTALNIDRRAVEQAVKSAFKQISRLLPVLIGIIFLVGFFSAFLTQEMIASFFPGALWGDSLAGAFIGSLFAGNPVTSYIIGERLLELSVSSVAVTAFLCSWVTVGLIQLPAEIASLGWKFAIIRNLLCFVLSIGASILMMSLLKIINI